VHTHFISLYSAQHSASKESLGDSTAVDLLRHLAVKATSIRILWGLRAAGPGTFPSLFIVLNTPGNCCGQILGTFRIHASWDCAEF
jgi:hypothetical protein